NMDEVQQTSDVLYHDLGVLPEYERVRTTVQVTDAFAVYAPQDISPEVGFLDEVAGVRLERHRDVCLLEQREEFLDGFLEGIDAPVTLYRVTATHLCCDHGGIQDLGDLDLPLDGIERLPSDLVIQRSQSSSSEES